VSRWNSRRSLRAPALGSPKPRARPRPPTPPRALDPVFALIERIDRGRRRIQPTRDGAVLGVELRRHRGPAVRLSDGTRVEAGSLIADLHLDNAIVAPLWGSGWRTAFGAAAGDLRAYAATVAAEPPVRRPVALRSGGLLTAGSHRLGFEVGPPRGGFMGALESWYLRGLLVRWNPGGRRRLDRGHAPLRTREAWLSTRELLRRYGPAAGGATSDTSSTNGPSRGPPSTSRSGPNGPGARAVTAVPDRRRPASRPAGTIR